MAKFKRKVTEPELIVRGLLQQLGVEFVEQYPVGYHTVDFFVPSKLLVVQADGDYWHANPLLYPDEGRLSSAHRKQRGVDCSCNSYLLNHGYRVVRLWENDLHKKPEFCAEVLREALEMRIK